MKAKCVSPDIQNPILLSVDSEVLELGYLCKILGISIESVKRYKKSRKASFLNSVACVLVDFYSIYEKDIQMLKLKKDIAELMFYSTKSISDLKPYAERIDFFSMYPKYSSKNLLEFRKILGVKIWIAEYGIKLREKLYAAKDKEEEKRILAGDEVV